MFFKRSIEVLSRILTSDIMGAGLLGCGKVSTFYYNIRLFCINWREPVPQSGNHHFTVKNKNFLLRHYFISWVHTAQCFS